MLFSYMRPAKKKNVSHARCCTPLHMEFLIVFPLHMSWVHFDYRWFPRVSLESPSPTVSTSALWRVQTLTLYSHMQMKLHMHDEKYDVDIFAACSQLEILRRKKKKWFDADPKRSSKRSSKQLLDTRSTWIICIVGRFPRSRGRSVHGWSFRLL